VLPIICNTSGFEGGDELEIDTAAGIVKNLTRDIQVSFEPLPDIMREIQALGGLVNYVQHHGGLV
jgi:3-isopropylmalate/(R)-2-methylmalate dehydratase small subunit